MRKIRFNHSLVYTELDKQHGECTVSLFLCKRVTQVEPIQRSVQRRLFHFVLSIHHPNNRLENLYKFYFPFFISVVKNVFLGRKISERGLFPPPPLYPPNYAYGSSILYSNTATTERNYYTYGMNTNLVQGWQQHGSDTLIERLSELPVTHVHEAECERHYKRRAKERRLISN